MNYMNKRIAEPLIVDIVSETSEKRVLQKGRRLFVPTNVTWTDFKQSVDSNIQEDIYDSVIVHVGSDLNLDEKGVVQNVNIKMNHICKQASKVNKAVLSDASKETWYLMNPSWDDQKAAHGYAPSDDVVLGKFESFADEFAWQAHQAGVWSRMADMMPLSTGSFAGVPNHLKQLTDPSRGLEESDLDEFWSFRSNVMLSPALMGDDMIGMPGIDAKDYDGFTIVTQTASGPVERNLPVKSLKTIGMPGIAIPMANVKGDVPKYQIATDPTKINVRLQAKAADGVSIQKSEYFNKKTNQYLFKLTDGRDSQLQVQDVSNNGDVRFSDVLGTFDTHMKADVKTLLQERGYQLPSLINTLKVVPNAKYIWQSKGTMVGSDDVCKTVSPSNAGFTVAREPKNGADDYVVLVAEGALKGRIVAKYADVTDRDGNSFGDYIAKDSGIIVAQVPGVSHAFVESVKPIYDAYNVKGTYIAMDADGRENLAVARGIDGAYRCLSECSPMRVMSWNPEQKGLDDSLLAVAQDKITLADMGIRLGSPEKLFPLSAATAPNPYRLDGSRANRQDWIETYEVDKKDQNDKIKALQEETKRRAAEAVGRADIQQKANRILNGGEDLAANLPSGEDAPPQL